ncbi:PASTA domain-containing protein [Microbispora sp. NPDC046933]|uniref:PASTA domain-containing protein n=1 Tax=Microbispora sp. NPDC046933 TaxID=3155618 RepID=UPI0033F82428
MAAFLGSTTPMEPINPINPSPDTTTGGVTRDGSGGGTGDGSGGGTDGDCAAPAVAGLPLPEALKRINLQRQDTQIYLMPSDIPQSWESYVIDARVNSCGWGVVTLELGTLMPDLRGSTLREATDTLASRRVGIRFRPEGAGSEWKVVTQNPGVGELIAYDTRADVEVVAPASPSARVVSSPSVVPSKPPATVTVPTVEGLDLAHARKRLAAAGLRLRLDPDSPHSGTVVGQTPAGGSRVATKTTVTVRLAREAKGDAAASGDEEPDLTAAGAVVVALLIALIVWWARGRRPAPDPSPGRRPAPDPSPGRRPAADPSPEHHPGSLSVLCVPHSDPAPRVLIRPTARAAQAAWPDFWVESHPDPGHQELREAPR